jgi:uncharacterized peroxidase-related enzyme
MIIPTIDPQDASGTVADIYRKDIAEFGYVAPHTRVLALHPEAYDAWEQLIGAIAGPMDKRRYELVTLAAALGIGSPHCRLAHGRKSLGLIDEAQLIGIARDYRTAGLPSSDVAMMAFAEKLSRNSSSMTDADTQVLRNEGFSDEEIVQIVLAAAARNYLSRTLQALGSDVDDEVGLGPELRAALLEPLLDPRDEAGR